MTSARLDHEKSRRINSSVPIRLRRKDAFTMAMLPIKAHHDKILRIAKTLGELGFDLNNAATEEKCAGDASDRVRAVRRGCPTAALQRFGPHHQPKSRVISPFFS